MLIFLHEMLLKVPTPLIWSLKPYGLAVPSSLIQNSSLVLRSLIFSPQDPFAKFAEKYLPN